MIPARLALGFVMAAVGSALLVAALFPAWR